jgi:PAS domain S-box-containing protein
LPVSVRVLILEDSPQDAELMVHELRHSDFAPDWRRVDTEHEYLDALKSSRPDVILADYRLPRLDASRALELARGLDWNVPFIVVSGAIGEDIAVAMMRRGATDYLLKDRLARLGPAVKHALFEKALREETRHAEQALLTSEIRFHSFMHNSPALAYIKNQDGRVLYMNNTCEQLWDMTLAECEGKLDRELWPADVAARLRDRDLSVLANGEASRTLEEIPLRNGGAVPVLTFRFPFSDAAGERLLGGVSVDISEQVRTQKALSRAVAAKEALLKEVHHRVKNNLQVISSLLMMQSESERDSRLAEALQESQKRVQCMALIHERLNRDDDPDYLNFRDFAGVLARDLFYSHGADSERLHLRLDLNPVSLPVIQAIPCGLILNELVTNALKYAFPEPRAGLLVVELSSDENGLVKLTVADDGIGLPPGFDLTRSQSLGLRIVDILTRQLDGTMRQEPGPGAGFSLTFQSATPQPAQPAVNETESVHKLPAREPTRQTA